MKKIFGILLFSLMILTSCNDNDFNSIDYTEFDAALLEANDLADVSKEGDKNGDIIIGSTEILNSVIEKYTPYRETAINQGTIDLATKWLQEAVETYKLSIVIVDGTTLESTIANAQALHDDAVEGEFPGEYQIGSKAILQTAIDAATSISNNAASSTQAEIDAALSDLFTAINNFNNAIIPPLDFDTLNSTIDSAQALYDNAVEGTSIGEYSIGSKAIFLVEINKAKAVVANTDPQTQGDINDALTALQDAITTFEAGKVGGPTRDLTALEAEILSAQQIHNNAIEGNDLGQYPIGSKTILQQAINDAQAVVDDLSLGQQAVDAALANLKAAVDTFQNSINAINVLNFGGDAYVETSTFQGISGGAQRTVEAWIKTSASANTETLILSWGVGENEQKWDMRLNGGRLRIEYQGGGSNGTNLINDGTWHHVAVVVPSDGASMNDVELYVDGVLEVKTGPGGAAAFNTSNVNNFNIGRSATDNSRLFIGQISDVRIWNVAKSITEINENKDKRLNGTEAGLVGYWKLNDGSGTSVTDSSSSNHVGNILGSNFSWEKIFTGLPFSE